MKTVKTDGPARGHDLLRPGPGPADPAVGGAAPGRRGAAAAASGHLDPALPLDPPAAPCGLRPDVVLPDARALPRSSLADADPSGRGAHAGAFAGRVAPAVHAVLLGATAVAGMSGVALAAPIDAAPGPGPAAPAGALSSVGLDAAAPLAMANEVLFGVAAPAPAPSALQQVIEAGGVLRADARGPEVSELQRRLGDLGFAVPATGVYDPDTVRAVTAFQRLYRVGADGSFGAESLGRLEAGERVTDPGRRGVGKTWAAGRSTGEVELRYIGGVPVTVDAANALRPMFVAAERARAPIELKVVSGFRTFEQQEELYTDYRAGRGNLAARPGHSNHHSGIAVDLNTSDPGVYRWLRENARSFGFIRTVPSEKWHWEFRPDLTGHRPGH